MKLSNAQVAALANKIVFQYKETVIEPLQEKNREVQESDEYVNFEKNDAECQAIIKIAEKYKTDKYYWQNITNAIKSKAFEGRFVKINPLSLSIVEQEIHLQTIDAADLDTLIAKVSAKFV